MGRLLRGAQAEQDRDIEPIGAGHNAPNCRMGPSAFSKMGPSYSG
jgi:hypothetical protein